MFEKINDTVRLLDLIQTLNHYGSIKEPFFFCISYDLHSWDVQPLKDLSPDIWFSMNEKNQNKEQNHFDYEIISPRFEEYQQKFDQVIKNIKDGNTYLLNLSAPSKIKFKTNLPDLLEQIYKTSDAKFKLKYKDQFVCFSPERFVKIENNSIFTYPMKGTIDANVNNAQAKILANEKEMAEHTMVVDLLRNDLGIVSSKINVEKFRYVDKIKAGDKKLLQVSSKISGKLQNNWNESIGNILTSMLPAGSITGTPKKKTVELIDEIENYNRGFYTGIFGVYDGKKLDSAVLIRFIEKKKNEYFYKSGGGITLDSNVNSEYQELLDKVYIP